MLTTTAVPLKKLLSEAAHLRRSLKIALPLTKGPQATLTPDRIAARLYERAREFLGKATRLERLPANRGLHRRLTLAANDVCDDLVETLTTHNAITNGTIIGATAHSLSLMQDVLWDSAWIGRHYDALVMHLWEGSEKYVSEMAATDVSSALYAVYAFRDMLPKLPPPSAPQLKSHSHDGLVEKLVERFDVVSEMGTSQDALSVLMGMGAVTYRNPEVTEKLLTTHLIPQLPLVNYEVLGHFSWAMARLKPPNAVTVMEQVVQRFMRLSHVECSTQSIEIFSNVVYGLALVEHPQAYDVASKLIKYLDRVHPHDLRPRAIVRLALGVSQLDAHTPSFIGKILKETIRSGKFFTPAEITQFKEAIDEMNIEPTDQVWESLAEQTNLIL